MNYKERVLNGNVSLQQEAARRVIGKRLGQSVPQLVEAATKHPEAFDLDENEVLNWSSIEDYSEAVRSYLADDADVEELERAAEIVGYWDDVRTTAVVPEVREVEVETGDDDDGDAEYHYFVTTQEETKVGRTTYAVGEHEFDDEEEANELAVVSVQAAIAAAIMDLASDDGEIKEIAEGLGIDPDTYDVYEYYSIESYHLKEWLQANGELVFTLAGFDIWGRTCTGQSVSMDDWVERYLQDIPDYESIWEEVLNVQTWRLKGKLGAETREFLVHGTPQDLQIIIQMSPSSIVFEYELFKPEGMVELKV